MGSQNVLINIHNMQTDTLVIAIYNFFVKPIAYINLEVKY